MFARAKKTLLLVAILTVIYGMYRLYLTNTPSPSDSPKKHEEANAKMTTQFGYILATDFFDQMTAGAINILTLQCWAGAISERVMVVEPFVLRGSSYGVSHSLLRSAETAKLAEEEMRLQDVSNMENWENQIKDRHFASFKNWNGFMESAPKNLIVVGKSCKPRPQAKEEKNCNDRFNHSSSIFAELHSFNIVRYVQVKYKDYSFDEFRSLIYGDHKPNESVVLFHHWAGVERNPEVHRIGIAEKTPCDRNFFFNFLFKNSPKIVQDSKRYLDRYMPNGDYISVMLRLELLLEFHHLGATTPQEQKLALVQRCVNGIVTKIRTMQKLHKTTRVFLTVDCQKYGTDVFRDTSSPEYMVNKDLIKTTMTILFSELSNFGIKLSFKEWEASYDEVASFKTPGYVALLQKNLAASGTCLVTAGGGSFQMSARALYKSIHNSKNISSQCVASVPQC